MIIKITKVTLRILSQVLIKFKLLNLAKILSSIRASILLKKSVNVYFDGEDWIYKWNKSAAVSSVSYYDPNFNYIDLDLFFFNYIPKKGDVIVNLGVENGSEIPEFCNHVGHTGKVYAVEADPYCCRRLEKLKKILNLNNLIIINMAVGSKEQLVKLTQENNEISNSIILNEKANNKYIKVKQKRLDQILEPFNEIKINYVKSNIEGSEKELLIGLNKSKLSIENWCISCHDFKGIEYKSYDFVLSWLKKSGYKTSNYTPQNTKNIWRNYYLYGSKNNND
tara:strand:+ start:400 stop:1239 length:840 start_codon:yes stop_codon:yes gene_type:complete